MPNMQNTLDHVRRIEDVDERMDYVLKLDDSLFDDLEIFQKHDHAYFSCDDPFRFSSSEDEYAAIIVGAPVLHYETDGEKFIAGYESNVFQLCKGVSGKDKQQKYVVGLIVAQSTGGPLDINDLFEPEKFEKEKIYLKKVFKKMGLPELSENVSMFLDACYF